MYNRYTEKYSWTVSYIKRQVPMVCNLINNHHEVIDLLDSERMYAWVIGMGGELLGVVTKSTAEYSQLPPDADFEGY